MIQFIMKLCLSSYAILVFLGLNLLLLDTTQGTVLQKMSVNEPLFTILPTMDSAFIVGITNKNNKIVNIDTETGHLSSQSNPSTGKCKPVNVCTSQETNQTIGYVLWKHTDTPGLSITKIDNKAKTKAECSQTFERDVHSETCFHSGQNRTVVACGRTLKVLDENFQVLLQHHAKGDIRFCQITPDGEYVAYVHGKKEVGHDQFSNYYIVHISGDMWHVCVCVHSQDSS